MSAPTYVMRAAGPADLEDFKRLREIAGAGFTSLMLDDAAMAAKLALAEQSFASTVEGPGAERYFMALEHIETGALAGCCQVKSTIGNYEIARRKSQNRRPEFLATRWADNVDSPHEASA